MSTKTLANRLDEIVGLLTEIRDGTSAACSQLTQIKEERETSPHTPYVEKGETNNNNNAGARERFIKPTIEEVADHIRDKGYTFDAKAFWNYYESKGWIVGRTPMKKWRSACVAWQRKERPTAARNTARRHADNWIGCSEAERKEFIDGLA